MPAFDCWDPEDSNENQFYIIFSAISWQFQRRMNFCDFFQTRIPDGLVEFMENGGKISPISLPHFKFLFCTSGYTYRANLLFCDKLKEYSGNICRKPCIYVTACLPRSILNFS